MPATIAFHGDFGTSEGLERDAGYPKWIDLYEQGWRRGRFDLDYFSAFDSLVLVGYSRGGSHIGHLSTELTNIAAAVLYESPLIGIDRPGGSFPVLSIWNHAGVRYPTIWWTRSARKRQKEAEDTIIAWQRDHPVDIIHGRGRHTKTVSYWPFRGHGWDVSLNPYIEQWIKEHA